ncbi:hypothetical protein OG897_35810 [Streptomyces sp. NBC_00237]|uniref:hypothetical protein n=1 Tax=Streptomyces sp. NBC_00237 TaxID=2975687 RepID=UPI0022543401|nr:hypothetical protein [Streptomyces sp. NBC_00237]MCX5206759.1 hypothetical protein [Streptomyces sp. NBC_00237]
MHVLEPVERVPVVLLPGTEVKDPAVAEQITNPRCWESGVPPAPKAAPSTSARKAKTA